MRKNICWSKFQTSREKVVSSSTWLEDLKIWIRFNSLPSLVCSFAFVTFSLCYSTDLRSCQRISYQSSSVCDAKRAWKLAHIVVVASRLIHYISQRFVIESHSIYGGETVLSTMSSPDLLFLGEQPSATALHWASFILVIIFIPLVIIVSWYFCRYLRKRTRLSEKQIIKLALGQPPVP